MTMPTSNGILDLTAGQVFPPDLGTWETADTWDDFNQWIMLPDVLDYALEPIDLQSVKTFCLKIQTDAVGLVSYTIYTSDTGAFDGEETITTIEQGDTSVPAFTAQYVWIEVTVEQTAGVNVLNSVNFSIVEKVNKFSINNVNTEDINDGSSEGYLLPIDRQVGTITNVQITPQAVTPFELDVYVTDYATSTIVIPHVTSKSSNAVSFALYGLDNKPRDAIVDVLIEYLPEMYMDGNDLLVR
jgi:hypothetical protein